MITALVTLFNPDAKSIINISSIVQQADRTILCDNSSRSMESKFKLEKNVIYLFNNGNLGISNAFNKVLKEDSINWDDNDFVFFFDQDTVIPEGHLRKMVTIFETAERVGINIGCLGPAFINTSSGMKETRYMKKELMPHLSRVNELITSSMLTRFGILRSISFWNEELFLDLCDWDLCWRVNEHGYICAMTDETIIFHSIGKGEVKAGIIKAKEGAPFREYYQTRDCLKLINKKYTPFNQKIRFVAQVTIRPILHLCLLPDKKERIQYIWKGVHDYIVGIDGSLEEKE